MSMPDPLVHTDLKFFEFILRLVISPNPLHFLHLLHFAGKLDC